MTDPGPGVVHNTGHHPRDVDHVAVGDVVLNGFGRGPRRVRRFVVPFNQTTTPWAALSLLAARLDDQPDLDDDPY